jgi:hypothetical protein
LTINAAILPKVKMIIRQNVSSASKKQRLFPGAGMGQFDKFSGVQHAYSLPNRLVEPDLENDFISATTVLQLALG